jgi:hypothetical protein
VPSFTVSAQESALLYTIPYYVAQPFVFLGFQKERGLLGKVAPLFWLAPLAALEAFAVFSNSLSGVSFWIRTPNFICVPAAILTAVGLYWVYERTKGVHTRKLVKPTLAAVILVITVISIYGMYATVSLQDPNMGYQWVYSKQEFKAGTWITQVAGNQTITGDVKVTYLMRDYFAIATDETQGFRYLDGDISTQPNILFTYGQMQKNGYLLAIHGLALPENWTEKTSDMNLVYTNKLANIYAGVNKP